MQVLELSGVRSRSCRVQSHSIRTRTNNANTSTLRSFVSRSRGHMQIRKVSDMEAGGQGYGCVQDVVQK